MPLKIGYHAENFTDAGYYAWLIDSENLYWNPSTSAFETFSFDSNYNIDMDYYDYQYYFTELGLVLPLDMYNIRIYAMDSDPYIPDTLRTVRRVFWDGTKEVQEKEFWELINSIISGGGSGGGDPDLSKILRIVQNIASKTRAN